MGKKTKDLLEESGERIAKYLSRAGICSRRDAERLIAEGRVRVDGEVITNPATHVSDINVIKVDNGSVGKKQPPRLFLFHKPVGLITTTNDPQGRPTVFDVMPRTMPRVLSVGRLDINTEGLLLMTNDGGLKRYLELPDTGWVRTYRVRVMGSVYEDRLERVRRGITIEGIKYGPMTVRQEKAQTSANTWLVVSLTEGKNREVRKVLEAIGLRVNRLIRTSYGPFKLGKIARGEIIEIKPDIVKQNLPKAVAKQIFG